VFGELKSSIKRKLLLPLPVFAGIVLLVLVIWVPNLIQENTRQTAIANATQIVNQFKVIRGYYTRNVVSVVRSESGIAVAADHADNPGAIPLPASFVHDVSDLLEDEATSIHLVSAYPFPVHQDRELDMFQQEAWTNLTADPEQVISRVERLGGNRVLRVAVADLMVDASCVDCHNSHAASPRDDWAMGDVRGILEVRSVLDDQYAAANLASMVVLGLVAVLLLALTGTFLMITHSVVAPLGRVMSSMQRLARREPQVEITDQDRADEIGEMARALEVFKRVGKKRESDEAALKHYSEELQRSHAELEVFASAASHDLQEPLRKIQTFGERLTDKYADKLDDTGEMYIDRMVDAASRMRKLIDALLVFSRVNSSNTEIIDVDLSAVLKDVVDDLGRQIEEANASIVLGDLPRLEGDETQMRVLFQNLISNGLKFRAPDRPVKIVIEASTEAGLSDDRVQISVADNGIGFDPRYASRIFGMFERLHSRSEFEGTGVGLATCRKIAERHGGSLTATGEPGIGSVFTLILPRRQANLS
jgi:signal transduction histidine kinase